MKKLLNSFVVIAIIIFALSIVSSADAQGSTFTVTNLNDSGPGSLRQAILNANSSAGPDTIIFAVAGTINVMSQLPDLNDLSGGTMIDGSTAPGYTGEPMVALQGPSASGFVKGLVITSANNTIHALQIVTFSRGIQIIGSAASGNVITGNYIGTNGTTAVPNYTGIEIDRAPNNRIGTNGDGVNDALERNVISGNNGSGIFFVPNAAPGNVIAGNFIGTDAAGTSAVGNLGQAGVQIIIASGVRIGTDGNGLGDLAERNVISGNPGAGIMMTSGSSNNIIAGNYIGTDVTGTYAIGNATFNNVFTAGIFISGNNNRIGTDGDGVADLEERNLISGNNFRGIIINSGTGNIISGNYVGTNGAGTAAIPNTGGGVFAFSGTNALIGTNGDGVADLEERNVISGNSSHGIYAGASGTVVAGNYIGVAANGSNSLANTGTGIRIDTGSNQRIGTNSDGVSDNEERNVISGNGQNGVEVFNATNAVVTGNYIGTNSSGTAALGNSWWGLQVINTRVGTNADGIHDSAERNLISGNGFDGVLVSGSGSVIAGNYIGTDVTGNDPLGNGDSGVYVSYSSNNTIGGSAPGVGNLIMYNGEAGVEIPGGTGNAVRSNNIFANALLGIDLGSPGVTANDPGDGDSGANDLQNFPLIASATIDGINTIVEGTLNSAPNTDFTLEFFSNTAADPSGYGEGETFLGSTTVTTDGSGNISFVATLPTPIAPSQFITATATGPAGNTSEFSVAFQLVTNQPPVAYDDSAILDEDGSTLIDVTANDTDPDGNLAPATAAILSGPSHGNLTDHDNGTFTYAPDANFAGADSFTYQVCDADGLCDEAAVSITISPVNDAPVADAKTMMATEDTAAGITLTGSDVDGDPLTFSVVTQPAHGTLSGTAPNLTYTSGPDYSGPDGFTYKANDGMLDSNVATVTITVASVNDAPLADDQSVTTDEDTPVDITLTGSDVDGDPLSFNVIDLPTHGVLNGTAPNLTYTPNLNFFGSDSFTFQACDAGGLCALAIVQVEVIRVNYPPTVDPGGPYSVVEGGSVEVTATGHDPEDGSLTYEWDLDNNGTFEAVGQTVIFSASGLDDPYTATIKVRATDDGNLSATAQTTVVVLNVAPVVETITAPIDPIQVNTTINTSVNFTDPGVLDTHTAVWDWGDNSTSAGTVNETNGSGTVTGNHTYTSPGVYTLKVTVTDDDGGLDEEFFRYVVVYDPNGGFVTGGGWINSPEGAYVADPSLTGKANFGFVSKYQRGATVPTGQTEFQFHVADLNFKSTSYDWLVIAGTRAQYKGTGTINGAGEYGFLLTAIDGSPDKFRIKIWEKATDEIVYDNMLGATDDSNPTTSLEGGSIVIHRR